MSPPNENEQPPFLTRGNTDPVIFGAPQSLDAVAVPRESYVRRRSSAPGFVRPLAFVNPPQYQMSTAPSDESLSDTGSFQGHYRVDSNYNSSSLAYLAPWPVPPQDIRRIPQHPAPLELQYPASPYGSSYFPETSGEHPHDTDWVAGDMSRDQDLQSNAPPPAPAPPSRLRAKRHKCEMCEKAFDRPSTLKKHWLVHTKEKRYSCDKCNARFTVQSNLNRHAKKCNPALGNVGDQSQSPPTSYIPSSQASTSAAGAVLPASPPRKRARPAPRTPSPWIPDSLRNFVLLNPSVIGITPVPLTPVTPNDEDERNSFDDTVSDHPYIQSNWKGRLPGPGFGRGFGMGIGAEIYGKPDIVGGRLVLI